MKIVINDERVLNVIPVALENIKAEIVETKEQTFETLDEKDEVVLTTLNVIQPSKITTLKDLDAEISNTEICLSQTQSQVESLTAELQKKRDLRAELGIAVQLAYDQLQVELNKQKDELDLI
jgi:hypothetical protein